MTHEKVSSTDCGQHHLGFIFALLSALFWGTYGAFVRYFTDIGFREIALVTISPTVMAVFSLIIILVKQPKALLINRKMLFFMLFHGAIISAGVNFCSVRAISLVPVGIVSIISFCHIIILIVVTRIVFGYKITKQKTGAALIALIGISFVLGIFQLGPGTLNLTGVFWATLIPFGIACAYTLIKFYLIQGINYLAALFYTNLFGGMVFWYVSPPWEMVKETLRLAADHGPFFWLLVFGFVFIPLIGSYVFFGKAYQLIEPCYVSIIYSLEPVVATILGFFILNQGLSVMQLAGIVIILMPVIYIQYHEGKQKDINDLVFKEQVSHRRHYPCN